MYGGFDKGDDMPKKLDLTELPTVGQQKFEDRYPWIEEVLDGSVYKLEQGKDFTVKTETMYQALKGYAKRRQIELGLRSSSGDILVQYRGS